MYKLYSMQRSGNSYKVRLALALLNAPYRAVEIDILRGESRTPDFLARNPSGQVPLLEVAEGHYVAESNAILWYVAGGTSLAPESRVERAEALQWMFFEQHALEPNIGAAYFWLALVKGGRDLQTHALEDWMERGYAALQVMENHLADPRIFCRRPIHGRGYRALRLHPCRGPLRLRPSRPSRRSAAGYGGSSRPPASCPWTGSRAPISIKPPGLLPRPETRDSRHKRPFRPHFAVFRLLAAAILPAIAAKKLKARGVIRPRLKGVRP